MSCFIFFKLHLKFASFSAVFSPCWASVRWKKKTGRKLSQTPMSQTLVSATSPFLSAEHPLIYPSREHQRLITGRVHLRSTKSGSPGRTFATVLYVYLGAYSQTHAHFFAYECLSLSPASPLEPGTPGFHAAPASRDQLSEGRRRRRIWCAWLKRTQRKNDDV